MFGLVFGLVFFAMAVVFRDYARQDDEVEDYESAHENGIVALGCVVIAVVFFAAGLWGM